MSRVTRVTPYLKAAETRLGHDGHEAGMVLKDSASKMEFPEAYSADEDYWLNWLLHTRKLQCARPMDSARKHAGEVAEGKPAHCPHRNVYAKPLGMLTPDQMERLSEGYLEETPYGLIEGQAVPCKPRLEPLGLHKWKNRAIKRRRERDAQTYVMPRLRLMVMMIWHY